MSLDDALAAWAATVRLPDDAADGIYQRIVTTPAPGGKQFGGLGRTWWRTSAPASPPGWSPARGRCPGRHDRRRGVALA